MEDADENSANNSDALAFRPNLAAMVTQMSNKGVTVMMLRSRRGGVAVIWTDTQKL